MNSMLASIDKIVWPVTINVCEGDGKDNWSGDIVLMNALELAALNSHLKLISPGFKFRFVSKS